MLSISGRTSGLTSAVRAVTQCCGGRTIAPTPAHPLQSHWEEKEECLPNVLPYEYQSIPIEIDFPSYPKPLTSRGLSQQLFKGKLTVGTGIGVVGQQLRCLHNDIKLPNFDDYRRPSNKDPNKLSIHSRDDRRVPTDLAKVGAGVMAIICVKKAAQTIVANLSPAASTLALGVIEIDLSAIPEGKNITIKWNNKPVFVRHRTAQEIAIERAVDPKELRDPQTDEERSVTGKWLVVMANCTHLGCVPISHQGNWGGYYCPCHGSHYDAAGRIRKGPAPLNLEVPDHHIIESENKLILGAKAPAP